MGTYLSQLWEFLTNLSVWGLFSGFPLWEIIDVFTVLLFTYFIMQSAVYTFITVAVYRRLIQLAGHMKAIDFKQLVNSADSIPITLLVPSFNEVKNCTDAINGLMNQQYRDYEILFINDGSTDGTMDKLINDFKLVETSRHPLSKLPCAPVKRILTSPSYPNLTVLDTVHSGKADSLNTGLNYCSTPLFCTIDADTILDPDALIRVVLPFIEDRTMIATGGAVRIVNGCDVRGGFIHKIKMPENPLARIQVLEYVRAFMLGRLGWDIIGSILIISGAFGLFRRDIVVNVGGFSIKTVGEDMELVVRLHRYCQETDTPYKISFVPDPVAWTECPETLTMLGRQRSRWQRGLIETLVTHRGMLLNRNYGSVGMIALPYFAIFEMASPIIETLGYLSLTIALIGGRISPHFAALFLGVAICLGTMLSIASVALMELTFSRYKSWRDFRLLLWVSLIENFGFRQILAVFRTRGTVDFLFRKRSWGKMDRRGFSPTKETTS